ncbi:hypothetical protein KHQ88_01355 [Mycoplasmatota bacterium]|nr:hypothetical protein KHQ88_01355 [Mycoplasmatota bacterium]
MFKLIKRLILFLIIIIILTFVGVIIFLNSVEVQITEEDLPQDVYESSGNLSTMMQNKMISIARQEDGDSYNDFEDFLNIMILKTIRDNINALYDPLNGVEEESEYIINHSQFTLDYVYADITEDGQVKVTVSLKRNNIPSVSTALYFYFDMEVIETSMTYKLTLDKVYLDEREISKNVYDYIVSFADKEQIESQVDKGTLDLDEYTYQVSFIDFIPGF